MSKDFVKNGEGTSQTDGNGEEKEYSFDDLFAEANGLSASADSGDDIVGVEGTTDGTTNGSAPDNTNDGQDSGQNDGDSQVGDSDPNSNQAGTEDYKVLYEKEVQRTSSWNGRLSAKDREIRALQQQIADLTAKVETASKVTATKQEGEEADEAVSEFLKEFPELAGPIQKMIEKATKQRTDEVVSSLTERFNKTISPIAETVQETALERHNRIITTAHSDFNDIVQSGELQKWIEEQPAFIQPAMQRVYQQGYAQEVVDLITQYKKETGKLNTNTRENGADTTASDSQRPNGQAVRQKPAPAVRSKSSGPHTHTPKIEADDFEGAWKAALEGAAR